MSKIEGIILETTTGKIRITIITTIAIMTMKIKFNMSGKIRKIHKTKILMGITSLT